MKIYHVLLLRNALWKELRRKNRHIRQPSQHHIISIQNNTLEKQKQPCVLVSRTKDLKTTLTLYYPIARKQYSVLRRNAAMLQTSSESISLRVGNCQGHRYVSVTASFLHCNTECLDFMTVKDLAARKLDGLLQKL